MVVLNYHASMDGIQYLPVYCLRKHSFMQFIWLPLQIYPLGTYLKSMLVIQNYTLFAVCVNKIKRCPFSSSEI